MSFLCRAFFGVLLLFCVIGTIIDMVIEEQKEMKAAEVPLHTNDVMTEPLESGHTVVDKLEYQNSTDNMHNAVNSDNHPLLDPPNLIFSIPWTVNVLHSILG
jgi:hypothetical protein